MRTHPRLTPALAALLCVAGLTGPSAAQTATPAPAASPASPAPAPSASCPPILQHTFGRLQDEKPQSLCQYSGKVLLVVNTASYCGFTPQYKGLESLYSKYKDRGLVVLGFPSNDFAQEKGSNKDIAEFCENTYGVQFPMFVASSVKGAKANPLFQQLTAATQRAPGWNFYKYLIGRDGKVLASYGSITGPESSGLVKDVEKALAAR